jgi:hypothetical protein
MLSTRALGMPCKPAGRNMRVIWQGLHEAYRIDRKLGESLHLKLSNAECIQAALMLWQANQRTVDARHRSMYEL